MGELAGRKRVGRPPVISLEQIVECAGDLAQRVGMTGLTMALLADELGVTTTALYHYVPSRPDLIRLLVDAAFDRVEPPPADIEGWDQRLHHFESSVRHELRKLPGLDFELAAGGGGNPLRPAMKRIYDMGIEILSETGADQLDVRLAFTTVFSYMAGQLMLDAQREYGDPKDLGTIQEATGSPAFSSDDLFEWGFETVLAGLRLRFGGAVGGPRSPRRRARANRQPARD